MSERYSRLYALPENLYLNGSPVLIAAGALLKDNKTDKVLAQLKLCNLYHSPLTACKVHIRAFEPGGAELEGVDAHSYLDIRVAKGKDFGSQEAVYLPDNTTRRISVCVVQAVFEDGTVWQHPAAEWSQPGFKKQRISELFEDIELQNQYSKEVGGRCTYVPEVLGSLSLCTCGALNLTDEDSCHVCGRKMKDLLSALDVEELTRKRDARIAKEEAERIERERIAEAERKERERREEAQRIERERVAEEQRIAAEKRKKKNIKIAVLTGAVAAVAIAVVLVVTQVIVPANKYKAAEELLEAQDYEGALQAFEALGDYKDSVQKVEDASLAATYMKAEELLAVGDYDEAINLFRELNDYKDSKSKFDQCQAEIIKARYAEAALLEENGELAKAAIAFGKLGDFSDSRARSFALWDSVACRNTIAASNSNTVGLKSDGTVVVAGLSSNIERNVSEWTNITAVAVGRLHIIGLKSDGSVVAAGNNGYGRCDVSEWTDIVAVAAGSSHTVGLKSDGTVVAIGSNEDGQCDVSGWTDIVAVAAGSSHTVGLKSDGTVVAVGSNKDGQCNTSEWEGIVAVAVGSDHTVGLKRDGTVVAIGSYVTRYISEWTDIVAVAAGHHYTIGLKLDGTVVAIGSISNSLHDEVSEWTNIKLPN